MERRAGSGCLACTEDTDQPEDIVEGRQPYGQEESAPPGWVLLSTALSLERGKEDCWEFPDDEKQEFHEER